jgi:hypothetical protein
VEHEAPEDIVAAQFAGPKANLRSIYDRVVALVTGFGDDVALAPRKTSVALLQKNALSESYSLKF